MPMIGPSERMAGISSYAFAELDRKAAQLAAEGCGVIDFGVGDPTVPTPEFIRAATARGLETHRSGGYPSYAGDPFFLREAAAWMERRLGLSLDPDKEINITLGSKEAVFHVHEAFLNPGDLVISPSPGYPPYGRGALFAEGQNYYYPLRPEKDYLPDLDAIPPEVREKAKIFWICQPHVPSGKIMDPGTLHGIATFCKTHDLLLCSDEAYLDLYFDEPPQSIIQHAREGVLAFYSLSKRSAMTGYRCGWVAGDPAVIALFRRLKTNIDSGVPKFVQEGAVAALKDEAHVEVLRQRYRKARDLLVQGLSRAGLPRCVPEAGLYIWQKAPGSMTGIELAEKLLIPELALVTSPGAWLSEPLADGSNPGEAHIRLAFVPPLEQIEEAAKRLGRCRLLPA